MNHLDKFYQRIKFDPRIQPMHINLYLALHQCWIRNNQKNPVNISRSSIMSMTKIKGLATYHKGIKGLQNAGYIHYQPSYHPHQGSLIQVISLE
jgi:hypothetical protein